MSKNFIKNTNIYFTYWSAKCLKAIKIEGITGCVWIKGKNISGKINWINDNSRYFPNKIQINWKFGREIYIKRKYAVNKINKIMFYSEI